MRGWHPRTLGWATLNVRVKATALLWTVAGVLRLERVYGIAVRKSRWDDVK